MMDSLNSVPELGGDTLNHHMVVIGTAMTVVAVDDGTLYRLPAFSTAPTLPSIVLWNLLSCSYYTLELIY